MAWRAEKWDMDPAEQQAHAAAYDDAVLDVDREIDRLLEELENRGLLENTVIILAGDHGEQLGEHDLYGHMNSLYLPVLHVPLLIHDPRSPELVGRVSETVSLRNMGATILELAGVDRESARIPGTTLLTYAGIGERTLDPGLDRTVPRDTVFAVLLGGAQDRFWYPSTLGPAMFALVDSAYHYILNGDGSEELYARRDDPGERETLAFDPAFRPILESFRRTLGGLQGMFLPPPGL
jgi:arylsulfatase A-like enzyme